MRYLSDFFSLLYPRLCISCEDNLLSQEEFLCNQCLSDLPLTEYMGMDENPVKRVFEGRIEINQASSYLHFEKGNKTQKILHELKYKNNPDLGFYMGKLMGNEILEKRVLWDVNRLLPMPLHPSKKRERGYNQSDCIANGIGEVLQLPIEDKLVVRRQKTTSQTKKRRYERWDNVKSVFELNQDNINVNDHILLIDDVITTGATLEACAQVIKAKFDVKISVYTLARSD